MNVDDLLNLNIVGDAQIAPGGDRVAFSLSANGTQKGEKSPTSNLWVQGLADDAADQVTFGDASSGGPRWSPDGSRLAFLSDREKRGSPQIYLLDDGPRDARKLTDRESGAGEFLWSPSGEMLAFLSTDHVPESDNDVQLFEKDRHFRRLYRCDVETGESAPINHGDLHIWEFCWSPDSRSIAAIVSDDPWEWGWYSARLVRIDIETGHCDTLLQPERQIARPAWSPDGSSIALVTCRWSDPGMSGGDVLLLSVADRSVRNLTSGHVRSHYVPHWTADSTGLVSIAQERARAQICRISLSGQTTPLWTADVSLADYGGTYDPVSGRIALSLSRFDDPPEVWTGEVDLSSDALTMARLTRSNGPVAIPAARLKWLTWASVDGMEIEGLYFAPENSSPDDPPAMVTLVHGGPTGAASPGFAAGGPTTWSPLCLQAGIAVFMPNFRGSNGYGVEFAEANIGDLGGLDLQDILTGVDECVRRGLADERRLAIGGWSYGGYISAWAITQTDRFAAAVAGASITNWYSFHGGTEIPEFDQQYITAAPDELDGPYAWRSPLFSCKNVRTPTLFLHGEQDTCCPVGQAYEMARSMARRGVEVECAIYPREGHGFAERAHRKDMIERAVAWFTRHLGEK